MDPVRRPTRAVLLVVPAALALVVGCGGGTGPPGPDTDPGSQDEPATDPSAPAEGAPQDDGRAASDQADGSRHDGDEPDEPDDGGQHGEEVVAPAEVGANELGRVPVLMYHRLREDGGSDFDLTPEQFRRELEWLFDHGYRPVRTVDLVRGKLDVPAGTTPVVLTFDDSTREQAQLTDDGELDPDTALGILVEVAAAYDDVEPVASVYVITSSLFGGTGDGPRIVAHLHELGMEIGNHTHDHEILRILDDDEVQDTLATAVAEIRGIVPDAEVATLSLPLGVFPEDRELAARGASDAGEYHHEGILLVGAEPALSPFHADFEPLAIPRIRTSPEWDPEDEPDFGSRFWLERLEAGDEPRYVSDGNPETISFPAHLDDELDERFRDRANPY